MAQTESLNLGLDGRLGLNVGCSSDKLIETGKHDAIGFCADESQLWQLMVTPGVYLGPCATGAGDVAIPF